MPTRFSRPLFCAALVVSVAACGSGDDGASVPSDMNGESIAKIADDSVADDARPVVADVTDFVAEQLDASNAMGIDELMAGGTCPSLAAIAEPVEKLYVAANGNDSISVPGTKAAPLRTLNEAAKRFPSGGTIIVRGGEYPHQYVNSANGTTTHPLVIRAETGETPIFDGMNQTVDFRGTLHFNNPTNVVLMGLEVRNAKGSDYAAAISNGGRVQNFRIRNCHLHDINGPVARFSGDGIYLEGNDIHDGVLINSSNQPTHGWPTCIGTQPDKNQPTNPWATNIVVKNNHIRDCWGEGIALFFGTNGLVQDNIVERTWGVGIYIDNGSDVTVARNYVHMVDGMSVGGGAARPITLGLENYDQWGLAYKPMKNIRIVNNVAIGLNGIRFFAESSTSPNFYYDNFTISQNTFISDGPALKFGLLQAGKQLPTSVVIRNNVIQEGTASTVPYPTIFTLGGNAWLNDSLPPAAGATDVSLLNVTIPASITSATDLKPLASAVGTASSAGVTVDYECTSRSSTAPRRGAFEL